jgi:hypothetical protein
VIHRAGVGPPQIHRPGDRRCRRIGENLD